MMIVHRQATRTIAITMVLTLIHFRITGGLIKLFQRSTSNNEAGARIHWAT